MSPRFSFLASEKCCTIHGMGGSSVQLNGPLSSMFAPLNRSILVARQSKKNGKEKMKQLVAHNNDDDRTARDVDNDNGN